MHMKQPRTHTRRSDWYNEPFPSKDQVINMHPFVTDVDVNENY